jgi:hypothetical protein
MDVDRAGLASDWTPSEGSGRLQMRLKVAGSALQVGPIGSCQVRWLGSKGWPLRQTRLNDLLMQCPREFIFDLPASRLR